MNNQVVLPELGEGITKATVACWHVRCGDAVTPDDDVAEVVTDKATFHIPATVSGTIKQICVPEGREVKVGEVLAFIEPSQLIV